MVSVSGHQRRMVQTRFLRSSCQKLKKPFRLMFEHWHGLEWFSYVLIKLFLQRHSHWRHMWMCQTILALSQNCFCSRAMLPFLLSSFLAVFILLITFTDQLWFALVVCIVDTISINHHRYHRFLHVPGPVPYPAPYHCGMVPMRHH